MNSNEEWVAVVSKTVSQLRAAMVENLMEIRKRSADAYFDTVGELGYFACQQVMLREDFEEDVSFDTTLYKIAQIGLVSVMNEINDRLLEEADSK